MSRENVETKRKKGKSTFYTSHKFLYSRLGPLSLVNGPKCDQQRDIERIPQFHLKDQKVRLLLRKDPWVTLYLRTLHFLKTSFQSSP